MWQDVRFGLRLWARQPGLTGVVLLTLALGIGANTALFSLLDAVLLRPLPFPEPERLVRLWGVDTRQAALAGDAGRREYGVSDADFLDWRARGEVFEALSTYTQGGVTLLPPTGEPVRVNLAAVSADFFRLLGVSPVLGRFFEPPAEGGPPERLVVLGEALWRRQFGGDPAVLGTSVTLHGAPYTVLGVAPRELLPPVEHERGPPELWRLEQPDPNPTRRGMRWQAVIGRLRPGVTVAGAQAVLDTVNGRLAADFPATHAGWGARVMPLADSRVQEVRSTLWLLLGAVGCVLLIATVNVASLLVARATSRQRELALRAALGASRARLLRQLLVESLLVALAGGGLGLLLSLWGLDALVEWVGPGLPRLPRVTVDGRVLGFTLAVTLTSGLLFGLLPALQASRPSSRMATAGSAQRWTLQVLVAGEVALALVLLVGAGLMLRGLWRLRDVDPGFRPEQVLLLEVHTPRPMTTAPAQVLETSRRLLAEVGAMPGVRAVGSIDLVPLGGPRACPELRVEGGAPPPGLCAETRTSSAGYFSALGIPLVAGRMFDARDTPERPPVALINTALARRLFPGESPLGRRIARAGTDSPRWMEIIGVVGDVRQVGLAQEAAPEFHQFQLQEPAWSYTLTVRGEGDLEALRAAVPGVVRRVDPEMPVSHIRTAEALLAGAVARPRVRAVLLGLFAGLAAVLAAVGIAGVVSWSVAGRTREIGIRVALGARPRDVMRLVVGQGMAAVAVGLVLGVAGALALTRVLEGLLYEVSATDPLTFAGGVAVLTLTALGACYLPTRRALRVDPAEALRAE